MTLLCWLLGHDPQPKWKSQGGSAREAGTVDVWCGRCESYVEGDGCRVTVLDRASEMFAREDGGRE